MRLSARSTSLIGLIITLFQLPSADAADHFVNLVHVPDTIRITTANESVEASSGANGWTGAGVVVTPTVRTNGLHIMVSAPGTPVKKIEMHWNGTLDPDGKYLGDAWERCYGELEWKQLDDKRIMPWYFLASDGSTTNGYGVMTGAASMCCWKADTTGITLIADVRSGGVGVELGDRHLDACTVVCRQGKADETAFTTGREFCRQMCPHPRLPKEPIYGFNDWNCTYGKSTEEKFLKDAGMTAELSPRDGPRPYLTVDDGWEASSQGGVSKSDPWDRTNPKFGSTMPDLASKVKAMNAKPGLWYRALISWPNAPKEWRLARDKTFLDPTVLAVRQQIATDVGRFRSWGYQLLKHDFSTYDITGRWGNRMNDEVTPDGWAFADRSKTTAEVITELYRTIREAAGDDMVIDGCNTVSHLSAGIFEAQRIGDDTSGRQWRDTRRNGINCIGFRAVQQGTFYTVDPDCVGLATATAIPWEMNRQWLELESRSGAMLTVSWKVELAGDEQKKAIAAALAVSAKEPPVGEPLDWMTTRTPTRWKFGSDEVTYSW
jgi:alpha-galactosidase